MSVIEIIYSDEDFVVVNKPAGLLTHKTDVSSDKVSCLSLLRNQLGRWVYPVHRLDRPTSGVLLFALSPESASLLGDAMASRAVQKVYWAVVRGHVTDGGTLDKALASLTTGKEQPAVTTFAPLAHTEQPWAVRPYPSARYTLMQLSPLTGRTHQLRRHMKCLSRPIVGDTRYGDGPHNVAFKAHLGISRLMLHARELAFPHPRTGEPLRFTAGVDADFAKVLNIFDRRENP